MQTGSRHDANFVSSGGTGVNSRQSIYRTVCLEKKQTFLWLPLIVISSEYDIIQACLVSYITFYCVFSIIFHAIYGTVSIQLTHFFLWSLWEYVYCILL